MKLSFDKDTYSKKILDYMALAGCMPIKGAELVGPKITVQRILRRMKEEGYAIAYKIPERYLMLSAQGKHKLEEVDSQKYNHFQSIINTIPVGTATKDNIEKIRKMRRSLQQAKILILLDSLGVRCWEYEKPELSLVNPAIIPSKKNLYYTSIEIKAIDDYEHKNKISHTRAYGLISSPGGIYCVYHVGNGKMEWNKYGEAKIVNHLEVVLGQNSEKKGKASVRQAIIYVNSYNGLANILNQSESGNKKQQYELFSFDNIYKNLYFIPTNLHGKVVTQLLLMKNHHQLIMRYLYDDSYEIPKNSSVDCDAIKDGEYFFSFLECDVSRLKRFKMAMSFYNKEKFHVTCFEWQYETLKEYLPEECNISVADEIKLLEMMLEDD